MFYIKEEDNHMQNSVPEKVRILQDCLLPARQGTKSVLPTVLLFLRSAMLDSASLHLARGHPPYA